MSSIGCAAAGPDDFSEAFAADYPGYWVVEATADERARRHSPEAFNGDIVLADINGDGIRDFAVALAILGLCNVSLAPCRGRRCRRDRGPRRSAGTLMPRSAADRSAASSAAPQGVL